jgi:homoserine dehydrogenase
MKIGILGLGTVGGGVVKILLDSIGRNPILSGIKIVRIGVRDIGKVRLVSLTGNQLTTQLGEIVNDPEIDLIVEVMGGLEPARSLILQAINNGKHIVTANKSLIAAHGLEILALARDKKVCVAFEAAVGGGIPVIQCLQKSLGANRIHKITGIVNGTTNYILSQMAHKGVSYDKALADATAQGYAEADPTADVDGIDAAEKLSVLTLVGLDSWVSSKKISRLGIRSISEKDITYAKAMNCTIKLLANAHLRESDNLQLDVQPYLVENAHPLASINDAFNAIFIEGEPIGQVMLYGQGAGEGATASAVVSDIINIASSTATWQNANAEPDQAKSISQEINSNFYIRILTEQKATAAGAIAWSFGDFQVAPRAIQQQIIDEGLLEIVIVTELVLKTKLDGAINSIRGLPYVKEIANVIPILKA